MFLKYKFINFTLDSRSYKQNLLVVFLECGSLEKECHLHSIYIFKYIKFTACKLFDLIDLRGSSVIAITLQRIFHSAKIV